MEETIPEDIPDDVWKYAEAVEKVWRDLPPREAVEHHARAILAEREECAKVADREAALWSRRRGGEYYASFAEHIATSIRSGV
jgi:hypothetical protein